MFTRIFTIDALASSVTVVQSSMEQLVSNMIVGVTIAVVLFVLYYVLVLRNAGDRQKRRENP